MQSSSTSHHHLGHHQHHQHQKARKTSAAVATVTIPSIFIFVLCVSAVFCSSHHLLPFASSFQPLVTTLPSSHYRQYFKQSFIINNNNNNNYYYYPQRYDYKTIMSNNPDVVVAAVAMTEEEEEEAAAAVATSMLKSSTSSSFRNISSSNNIPTFDGNDKAKATDFANYFCAYAQLYHQKQMLTDHNRMVRERKRKMKLLVDAILYFLNSLFLFYSRDYSSHSHPPP